MNIVEHLLARGQDSAPAVLAGESIMTHGELRHRVNGAASMLLQAGHTKGDRVGLFAENGSCFVIGYLGAMRAGLVAVPFSVETTGKTFQRIAAHAGLSAAFVSDRFAQKIRPWAEELGLPLIREMQLSTLSAHGSMPFPDIDPGHDLAALMFTSGSTGEPKGVMITHQNILCNSRDIISYLGLVSEDRAMVVLPLHYCFGASLLHTLLMVGGSVVLNNDFHLYPESMLREMQAKDCTGFAGVPSTYQILLRKSRFRSMAFPRLRWFQQAGGKLPNTCIEEVRCAFAHARFFTMYGQTEACARLSYLPPEALPEKLGSIGKGLPSTRLEVLKPDGTPVAPGSEEVGEIVATGDSIAVGYWRDAAETTKYFRNGKLHTGDLAHIDSDGFIFIVDREREIIKSGGHRVSAKEIEDVIAEMPEVVEAAVVGVADGILGEAIHAFLVVSQVKAISVEMVKAHCRRRLPSFKVPHQIVFVSEIPHNSVGKVVKSRLLKRALGSHSSADEDAGLRTTQHSHPDSRMGRPQETQV